MAESTFIALDSWLDSVSPATNHGTDTILKVGTSGGKGSPILRTVMLFDVSGLPANDHISSVRLKFWSSTGAGSAEAAKVHNIFPTTPAWSETGVTWNDRVSLSPWSTAGGDFDTNEEVDWTFPTGDDVLVDLDLLAMYILETHTRGSTRVEILLKRVTETGNVVVELHSTQSSSSSLRPVLVVTHAPIAPSVVVVPVLVPAVTIDIAGGIALTPAAQTIPIVVASPIVDRQLTLAPAARAIPVVVASPTVDKQLTIEPTLRLIRILAQPVTISVTKTPAAQAIPVVVASPTVDKQLTIAPSAVGVPVLAQAVTISVIKTPAAVGIPVLAQGVTISVIKTPATQAIPVVVASPTVDKQLTLTPSAVGAPVVVLGITISVTKTPSALAVPVAFPAPVADLQLLLSPAAQTTPVVAKAVVLQVPPDLLAPSPVQIPVLAPSMWLEGILFAQRTASVTIKVQVSGSNTFRVRGVRTEGAEDLRAIIDASSLTIKKLT